MSSVRTFLYKTPKKSRILVQLMQIDSSREQTLMLKIPCNWHKKK